MSTIDREPPRAATELSDFTSYPFDEVLPPHHLRAELGYRFFGAPDHLTKYGQFYGFWMLPDGRIAKWNTWTSRLTIYPVGSPTHEGNVKAHLFGPNPKPLRKAELKKNTRAGLAVRS